MGNPNRLTNDCGVKDPVTVDSEIPGSTPCLLLVVSSVVNQAGRKFFHEIFLDCTGLFLIYLCHASFSPSVKTKHQPFLRNGVLLLHACSPRLLVTL